MKARLVAPVVGFWSSRPSVDWLLAGAAVLVHVGLVAVGVTSTLLWELGKDDRMRLVVAVATVSSLLFGFATASVAFFYGSAKGERVDLLKKVLNDELVRTWRAALSAPLVAVAAAVVAMAADTGRDGTVWVGVLVEVAVAFLAFRAIRLRWLFVRTLDLMSHDLSDPPRLAQSKSGRAPKAKDHPARRPDARDVPIS